MTRAANELNAQRSLRHRPRLAHAAPIHPHEVGLLGGKPGGVALAGRDRAIECVGQRIEIVLH